jgi:hypothetical protein
MKSKNSLLLIGTALISFFLLTSFTPLKTASKPCEVTGQFSPTTSDFAYVALSNCNNSYNAASVTAGTSWIPILQGAGCNTVNITTSLPNPHPGGTISIYRGPTLVLTHTVSADQDVYFVDELKASCDDYYHITW